MERVEIIDDVKWKSYCCFGKILQRQTTFENGAVKTEPFCSICGGYPPASQKSIKKLQRLCELLDTAEKQKKFIIEVGVLMKLPADFRSRFSELPENNTKVIVFTSREKILEARFEKFLGAEIWETNSDIEEEEVVIGWKKIN